MRRRLYGQENAPPVDLQHDVEFLQADGLKVAQSQDARVDDNDIEATKLDPPPWVTAPDRLWI
jgi:hypothetical protein